MKILLDLSEWQHLDLLKRWASVSRTLDTAMQLIARFECQINADSTDDEGEALAEQCSYTHGEIEEIKPMLDSLHQYIRSAVWAREAEDAKFHSVDIAIEGSSDLMLGHILQRYIGLHPKNQPKELKTTDQVIREINIRVKKAQKERGHI